MATLTSAAAIRNVPPVDEVPVLEQGDRLSRAEFERRYEAMPEIKKAELIEGVVHLPSPVRHNRHGKPHGNLITWLGTYDASTPGVEMSDNATTRLDLDNEFQPDALLMIDSKHGGQARVDDNDYIVGGPELIAEVASSSVSIDLHDKLLVYRRTGVTEYLVWRILDQAIDWFILRNGEYVKLAPGEDGVLRSEIFPGLWLDQAALIRGDMAAVLARLQNGIAAPEHAAFVAGLQQTASG
jgi:Uma2 family endonuclease